MSFTRLHIKSASVFSTLVLVVVLGSAWQLSAQVRVWSFGLHGGYASAGLHIPGRDSQPNFTPVGQYMFEVGIRPHRSLKRWTFGLGLQNASERQWATVPLSFDPNNSLPNDTVIAYNATYSYVQHSIGREWAAPLTKRHDNKWFFTLQLTAAMNILYRVWELPRQFTDYDVARAPVDYVRIDIPSRRPDNFTLHPSMAGQLGLRWQFARNFAAEVRINGGVLSQGFDFAQLEQRFHYRYGGYLGLSWNFWQWNALGARNMKR